MVEQVVLISLNLLFSENIRINARFQYHGRKRSINLMMLKRMPASFQNISKKVNLIFLVKRLIDMYAYII